jgi:hypothetical protein
LDDVTGQTGYIAAPGPFGSVTIAKYLIDTVGNARKYYKLFKDLSPEDLEILEAVPWE